MTWVGMEVKVSSLNPQTQTLKNVHRYSVLKNNGWKLVGHSFKQEYIIIEGHQLDTRS